MKLEQMTFEDIYLIYVNDFLTIDKMAEYYNVHPELLSHWIEIGKKANKGEDWEEFQQIIDEMYFNLL